MKKMEAYHWLRTQGDNELSFLANVILTQHANPALKLKGLVKGVKRGHQFKVAQFNLDVLLMDGERLEWTALEHWAKMKMYVRSVPQSPELQAVNLKIMIGMASGEHKEQLEAELAALESK